MKYFVRYGVMRMIGVFSFADEPVLRHGTAVIVRTSRGQETAMVLRSISEEGIDAAAENRILRQCTEDDMRVCKKISDIETDELRRCESIVASMKLEMELIRVEHIFGGERLVVYYSADGRIDFRELVKVLAGEFHTRVEMRQIGVRDETKLLADFGDCGREVCCNVHLIEIPPVSMKMAKIQKATLDPYKISGRCGRLKCCMRYEYDMYHVKDTDKDAE